MIHSHLWTLGIINQRNCNNDVSEKPSLWQRYIRIWVYTWMIPISARIQGTMMMLIDANHLTDPELCCPFEVMYKNAPMTSWKCKHYLIMTTFIQTTWLVFTLVLQHLAMMHHSEVLAASLFASITEHIAQQDRQAKCYQNLSLTKPHDNVLPSYIRTIFLYHPLKWHIPGSSEKRDSLTNTNDISQLSPTFP